MANTFNFHFKSLAEPLDVDAKKKFQEIVNNNQDNNNQNKQVVIVYDASTLVACAFRTLAHNHIDALLRGPMENDDAYDVAMSALRDNISRVQSDHALLTKSPDACTVVPSLNGHDHVESGIPDDQLRSIVLIDVCEQDERFRKMTDLASFVSQTDKRTTERALFGIRNNACFTKEDLKVIFKVKAIEVEDSSSQQSTMALVERYANSSTFVVFNGRMDQCAAALAAGATATIWRQNVVFKKKIESVVDSILTKPCFTTCNASGSTVARFLLQQFSNQPTESTTCSIENMLMRKSNRLVVNQLNDNFDSSEIASRRACVLRQSAPNGDQTTLFNWIRTRQQRLHQPSQQQNRHQFERFHLPAKLTHSSPSSSKSIGFNSIILNEMILNDEFIDSLPNANEFESQVGVTVNIVLKDFDELCCLPVDELTLIGPPLTASISKIADAARGIKDTVPLLVLDIAKERSKNEAAEVGDAGRLRERRVACGSIQMINTQLAQMLDQAFNGLNTIFAALAPTGNLSQILGSAQGNQIRAEVQQLRRLMNRQIQYCREFIISSAANFINMQAQIDGVRLLCTEKCKELLKLFENRGKFIRHKVMVGYILQDFSIQYPQQKI